MKKELNSLQKAILTWTVAMYALYSSFLYGNNGKTFTEMLILEASLET